jgi:hypothetical protein
MAKRKGRESFLKKSLQDLRKNQGKEVHHEHRE